MTGRHAQRARRRPRWPARLVAAAVALGVLAVGGYLLRDFWSPLADIAEASCEGSLPVSVAASPDIAPTLEAVLSDPEVEDELAVEGTCVATEVTPVASAEAAEQLGSEVAADLWIPESSLWAQRAGGRVTLGEGVSIATSPLVAVTSRPAAQEHLGWPDASFSWAAVLEGGAAARIADPMTTAEGLGTLLAVRAAVGDSEEAQTQLVQVMTEVARQTVDDVSVAYEEVSPDAEAAVVFTATEQSVVAHNRQQPGNPVVALYPADGTLMFDYPAIPVSTDDTPAATRDAAARIIAVLGSEQAVSALYEAGFRAPDATAGTDGGVLGVDPTVPTVLPTPSADEAGALLRQWAALSLEMRMLAVIDTSGSMWETDGGEVTRIELVRDAAKTALGLFPPNASVGLWAFSTDEDPPNHWAELVSIGPLTEEVGDNTQLEQLIAAADSLPEREVRGWTALYDTTLAAFQAVNSTYESGKVNSVVLMTDGTDERDPGMEPGIDRETLLSNLQAQFDPSRPVPIIAIGIGPDADMDALEAISEATGGSAHLAEDPADIEEVFLRAMIERQCRPNC